MERFKATTRVGLSLVFLSAAIGGCGPDEPTSGQPRAGVVRRGPVSLGDVSSAPQFDLGSSQRPELLLVSGTEQVVQVTSPTLEARLLVLSANGAEPALGAIRGTLDYLGVPYTVWVATERPGQLTPAALYDGALARYQGVILTTGALGHSVDGSTWRSALSPEEWQALWDFEAMFRVRQVTWYTYPTPDYGFGAASVVDTRTATVTATLTTAGRSVFTSVNPAAQIQVRDVYTYLARPVVGTAYVPLAVDAAGNALVLRRAWPDGRENLAMTFDAGPSSLHALTLANDVVYWVTRGLHLGERHAYASAHIDDFYFPNALWAGGEYRMSGADLDRTRRWQSARRGRRVTAAFRYDMVFNGEGAAEPPDGDTLVRAASRERDEFKWINHTWSHMNLNAVTYGAARDEVSRNIARAQADRLNRFSPANLVTGEISGLTNVAAMQAAFDLGVRTIVSDASRPEGMARSPNAGHPNAVVPGIFEVPRRATNLFYNVSTPAEWAGEYNEFYRAHWGRDLRYEEILALEGGILLRALLRGENQPWMFHQSNLREYASERSILGDLLDVTFNQYESLSQVPVVSPTLDELAARVAARTAYNACAPSGLVRPGATISLTAQRDCTVPVTGLDDGATRESYGGRNISYVRVRAGQVVTLRLR